MNRLLIKYAILTSVIFLPLLWSFVFVRNLYPITAWNVMMAGGDLQRGRTYCILRGETVSGEVVDIRPITLTNALYSRMWTMVNATVDNQSQPASSPQRLKAIRLDMYRWEGGGYSDYDKFVESWRKEL